jgi:hypothetical protein
MKRTGGHHLEPNAQGAIVYGTFEAEDDNVLDCADQETLEEIALSLKDLDTVTDNDIHAAYEMVVSRVEKALGRPMIVVKAAVPRPARMAFPLNNVLGNPAIFVVRKQFEKIKVRIEAIQ